MIRTKLTAKIIECIPSDLF